MGQRNVVTIVPVVSPGTLAPPLPVPGAPRGPPRKRPVQEHGLPPNEYRLQLIASVLGGGETHVQAGIRCITILLDGHARFPPSPSGASARVRLPACTASWWVATVPLELLDSYDALCVATLCITDPWRVHRISSSSLPLPDTA